MTTYITFLKNYIFLSRDSSCPTCVQREWEIWRYESSLLNWSWRKNQRQASERVFTCTAGTCSVLGAWHYPSNKYCQVSSSSNRNSLSYLGFFRYIQNSALPSPFPPCSPLGHITGPERLRDHSKSMACAVGSLLCSRKLHSLLPTVGMLVLGTWNLTKN